MKSFIIAEVILTVIGRTKETFAMVSHDGNAAAGLGLT